MGIASLVIGIWAVFLGFIPLLNYTAVMPALVGLLFGIIELLKLKDSPKSKSLPIAGTVLNSIALFSVAAWTFLFSLGISEVKDSLGLNKLNPNWGGFFDEGFFGSKKDENEDSPAKPFMEKINPFREGGNPHRQRKFKEKEPKRKKPYFKKEFRSEGPGSFHWRFERRYHSDKGKPLQSHKDFIEEFRKDMQKHFRFHFPKRFDSKPALKPKKSDRGAKQKKPQKNLQKEFQKKPPRDQFKQKYKEVI